jgi:hypothetical protein
MKMTNPLKDLAKQDLNFLDRNIHSAIFFIRHFFKKSEMLKSWDYKWRTHLANKLRKKKSKGQVFDIPRVKDITPAEFRKKFAKPGIPVIFDGGCKDWACTGKWNFDYLEKYYSETDFNMTYQRGFTPDDEKPSENYDEKEAYEKIKIKDLVQSIKTDGKKYMRFCPIMEDQPELIQDMNLSWLRKMRICLLGCSYQSFIGARKRHTPIHGGMTAFFFILPCGQKKWTLYPTAYKAIINPEVTAFGHNYSDVNLSNPDLEKYPGMDLLDKYEGIMNEGDILYVPSWLWHEVENQTDTWGVSYRFPYMMQAWTQSFTLTFKRFFLTDPPFWKIMYYSFIKTNISKRDKYLLTPKVFRD